SASGSSRWASAVRRTTWGGSATGSPGGTSRARAGSPSLDLADALGVERAARSQLPRITAEEGELAGHAQRESEQVSATTDHRTKLSACTVDDDGRRHLPIRANLGAARDEAPTPHARN